MADHQSAQDNTVLHRDPRIGDETPGPTTSDLPKLHVPSPAQSSSEDTGEKFKEKSRKPSDSPGTCKPHTRELSFTFTLPDNLRWIPNNFTWSKLKPVIRSAVAAWISVLFMVINPTLRVIGQAGFLILIASFLSPPSDPIVANVERELIIIFMIVLGWAWGSLGIKLASLARSEIIWSPSINGVFDGDYVEAAPSIILAVFLFVGSTFFLYIKARRGPGPFIFATVLGCITLDISMQTATLFPYPNYATGRAVVLPIVFHSAIAILCSLFIFPITISAQYTLRLRIVLNALRSALDQHLVTLSASPLSPDFDPSKARSFVNNAETALAPLAMSARLLKRDIVWHRFSGPDLSVFRERANRLVIAADGMNLYFSLIDPTRERFPTTPAQSRPVTPVASRAPSPARTSHPTSPTTSRPASLTRAGTGIAMTQYDTVETMPHSPLTPLTPTASATSTAAPPLVPTERRGRRTRRRPHFEADASPPASRAGSVRTRHSRTQSLAQALHLHLPHHHREHVVGVFESQRYLDLESSHFAHPLGDAYTARATALLRESAEELLERCVGGLKELDTWLETSRRHTTVFWRGGEKAQKIRKERACRLEEAVGALQAARERFKRDRRLRVLEPYRAAFGEKHLGSVAGGESSVPPHRYLFHCYVYQYHLGRFSTRLIETLELALELERKRLKTRVWFSESRIYEIWHWSIFDHHIDEREDDDNPDVVPGVEDALPEAMKRDPDALPPSNVFERIASVAYLVVTSIGGGNFLFAIKAGILTVILSIPSMLKSTAGFAYGERFNWAIFMGQLTLARFRGDTSFGLVARIVSTFLGGLAGVVMWYISTGVGTGSAYGLAAVCAVCFPFFFYARLYWPGPPMSNIIFFVTIVLVIGFSWQNTHLRLGTFAYYGINLAWRRFVLVTCGVVAAFIFSFLPPSTTLRRYQRHTLATTITETGSAYCRIVSFANARHAEDSTLIVQTLIAIRIKLKRSRVLGTNIVYEFSLRGRWPAERYKKILDLQLEIGYLLSHLLSVVEHLEPAWSRAFLRRTRFLDADFQGDVLAVISLVGTALRTGTPLPQITPCPLLDRFILHQHGLNVIRHEADDDYGLPRTMTIDTLENEQYSMFCVGVSTAFGIVTRLDRLMVATKELVGEQFHIHGVGFVARMPGVELASRTNSLRPVADV